MSWDAVSLGLVLLCALVTQVSTSGEDSNSFQQDLRDIFCHLSQPRRPENSNECSSTQKLFSLLGNDCSLNLSANKHTLNQTKNNTREPNIESKDKSVDDEDVTSSLVDWLVVGLLVCSAVFSLAEWCRERQRPAPNQMVGGGVAGMAGGRRYSLADLTVNRHSRRDSQQQMETIHQGTSSGGNPAPLLRQSSFPTPVLEGRSRPPPQRQQSVPVARRPSVDLSDDGDRRRVRIIRRH